MTRIEDGDELESDILIVGIGISPAVELAKNAGLQTGNGIIVDEYLCTSHPDMFISYNQVRLTLSTHKVGGLSLNDFIMAAKIDRIAEPPAS
ncbi:MAG: 4a-hydroxytetrahydrobiopterin dehydratase [Syntrophales bacterium]